MLANIGLWGSVPAIDDPEDKQPPRGPTPDQLAEITMKVTFEARAALRAFAASEAKYLGRNGMYLSEAIMRLTAIAKEKRSEGTQQNTGAKI